MNFFITPGPVLPFFFTRNNLHIFDFLFASPSNMGYTLEGRNLLRGVWLLGGDGGGGNFFPSKKS